LNTESEEVENNTFGLPVEDLRLHLPQVKLAFAGFQVLPQKQKSRGMQSKIENTAVLVPYLVPSLVRY
jgi:hypothetical protein